MFCQLETLRPCLPPSVRLILNELPETLDATYGRILQEIPKSNRLHAHRLLQCLTVAIRPLRVEELAEVLAVDFGTTGELPKLNENLRWEDQEQAVLSACSSLIAVVEGDSSRVVQFSHFSVKEYLTSDRLATSTIDTSHFHHILLEPSHTIMAQACLSVLLLLDSHINKVNRDNFPLARYASKHFGDHAEFGNVFSHIRDGIDDLLDADKPHFAAWLWVLEGELEGPPKRPEASPLYHVAGFGFRAMVDYLISRRPEDLSVRGNHGIPLHIALYNGHADVALLLLGHCTDVDVRGFDEQTPLHMAVDSGLLEVTRTLIERDATINARDSEGRTPLHPTFHNTSMPFDEKYFDVVRYIIEHGADVDAQANTEHPTPLHVASYCGGFKVAQLLLDHGADINVRGKDGRTPLHATLDDLRDYLEDYFFDTVRFLLEHGADIHALDNDHATPLHVVSQSGGMKATRLLLKHGADVHALDNTHSTPFHLALQRRDNEVARLLLEHGANVHALDGNHSTPLHFASESGNAETAHLLLQHGADVHALDNSHSTPLHSISQHSDAGAAHVLLDHGAIVDARNNEGSTPLHVALQCGNTKAAYLLLEHGAGVHALDNNHSTPLHFISQRGIAGAAHVLLEHGAIVDARNNEGSTPLHVASQCGNAEVARLLLERGADIYVRNKTDQTPQHLLLAMCSNKKPDDDVDTIRFLVEPDADVDAVDDNHSTPLHRASYHGNLKLAQLLLERGANINTRNKVGQTALYRVLAGLDDDSSACYFDTIQLLLENGADVDALDDAQWAPLHVASENGCAKATRLLLKYGASVHLQNKQGQTPSQVASAHGHEEITWMLSDHLQSEQKM